MGLTCGTEAQNLIKDFLESELVAFSQLRYVSRICFSVFVKQEERQGCLSKNEG